MFTKMNSVIITIQSNSIAFNLLDKLREPEEHVNEGCNFE